MPDLGTEVALDRRLKRSRVLRRYVDLPKLVDLLSTKTLYLGQSSRFEDPLEGAFPERLRHFLQQRSGSRGGSDGVAEWEQKNRERTYLGC